MAKRDNIENPVLCEWDRVVYRCRKHPRKVRWRAYRVYENTAARWLMALTSWPVLIIVIALAVMLVDMYMQMRQFHEPLTPSEVPAYNAIRYPSIAIFVVLDVWIVVTPYLATEICKDRYFNHCKEKFIWQRDRDYYDVYIAGQTDMTIEEWKPLRYAFYLWENESSGRLPFKVWYRNMCKNVINFDKYCQLRNHTIV